MPQTVSTEYLTQLVTIIKQQQQTGLLHIEQIGRGVNGQGEIYFEDGCMFHARVGDEHGRLALKHISEWAHVIYTFQPINKPPNSSRPALAWVRQPREARQLPLPTPAQTNNVGRTPRLTKNLHEASSVPMSERMPLASTMKQYEPMPFTHIKTAPIPTPMSQSFMLRGEALETYTPASSASPRWRTTHQDFVMPQSVLPSQPFMAPCLDQPPGAEPLPGQQAIFRAKVTITSRQTMQQMERRERIVFVLLDGQRTLQHIAYLLHQPENEVGHILLKLTSMGLAEYITD